MTTVLRAASLQLARRFDSLIVVLDLPADQHSRFDFVGDQDVGQRQQFVRKRRGGRGVEDRRTFARALRDAKGFQRGRKRDFNLANQHLRAR